MRRSQRQRRACETLCDERGKRGITGTLTYPLHALGGGVCEGGRGDGWRDTAAKVSLAGRSVVPAWVVVNARTGIV